MYIKIQVKSQNYRISLRYRSLISASSIAEFLQGKKNEVKPIQLET